MGFYKFIKKKKKKKLSQVSKRKLKKKKPNEDLAISKIIQRTKH